jgi:hypothetical protein
VRALLSITTRRLSSSLVYAGRISPASSWPTGGATSSGTRYQIIHDSGRIVGYPNIGLSNLETTKRKMMRLRGFDWTRTAEEIGKDGAALEAAKQIFPL